jgi:C4-dicarboxylate-specific signal transduction histidine kinase
LLPHLFKPHVSTKAGGGLGLHIVNSIVRSEEGEVTVANRVEGGAEFTIIVPHSSIPAFTRSATA